MDYYDLYIPDDNKIEKPKYPTRQIDWLKLVAIICMILITLLTAIGVIAFVAALIEPAVQAHHVSVAQRHFCINGKPVTYMESSYEAEKE